jgi:serine/threonine-protein kinase
MLRTGAVALVLALAASVCAPALAQSSANARADELFTRGKAALESGDYAHACPDLAESYRIDPAPGTLLALALCHEGMGLTATAWREFGTAVDGATKDGRADRAQFARTHMAKLESRLSSLTLIPPTDAPGGLHIDLDGVAVLPGDWGKASPIDPGHHLIAAQAAGVKPWTGTVDVGADHDNQTVKIGPLVSEALAPIAPPSAAMPAPPAEPPKAEAAPEAQSEPGAWKRPAGWIVGGAGVVAIGVGTYFGLSATSKSNDAKRQCSPSLCTSPGAVSENDDAKTFATVSDVAIGVGLAAVAVGAYLLVTAPASPPAVTGTLLTPFVGHQQAGLSLRTAF